MTPYTIRELNAFLQQWYGPRKVLAITPYSYTFNFTTITQTGTQTRTLPIQANADFCLLGFNHRANAGALQTVNTKTAPFVRLLITDTGTNERFTDDATDLENFSNNGNSPRFLPYPRMISGRSSLQGVVTAFAPAAETLTTLDVTLVGVLVRVLRIRTAREADEG